MEALVAGVSSVLLMAEDMMRAATEDIRAVLDAVQDEDLPGCLKRRAGVAPWKIQSFHEVPAIMEGNRVVSLEEIVERHNLG